MPYPYLPYNVTQTLDTLDLSFKVPPGSRSRDIEVKWEPKGVTACVKHQPPTIKGEFYAPVISDNSMWQLEGNIVTLHIEKQDEDMWPYVIKPGKDIDPCSQYNISTAMVQGISGLPNDRDAAMALCREAADRGMEDAQMKMGFIFTGIIPGYEHVTPSDSLAYTYFSYAANQHGNPIALFYVGKAFHTGTGVEKSAKMAESFYQKAAAHKHDTAIYNLGVLYRSSPATPDFKPDPKKALQCFVTAAEMGNPDACHSLGIAYFGGDTEMIGAQDLYKAKQYFEKAAKLSEGEYEVPEQLLEAIDYQEHEEKEEKEEQMEKHKKKTNETTGIAQEARENGTYGMMAGAVVVGLIAIFGFHWLASRN